MQCLMIHYITYGDPRRNLKIYPDITRTLVFICNLTKGLMSRNKNAELTTTLIRMFYSQARHKKASYYLFLTRLGVMIILREVLHFFTTPRAWIHLFDFPCECRTTFKFVGRRIMRFSLSFIAPRKELSRARREGDPFSRRKSSFYGRRNVSPFQGCKVVGNNYVFHKNKQVHFLSEISPIFAWDQCSKLTFEF